jgi:hypothetical protein
MTQPTAKRGQEANGMDHGKETADIHNGDPNVGLPASPAESELVVSIDGNVISAKGEPTSPGAGGEPFRDRVLNQSGSCFDWVAAAARPELGVHDHVATLSFCRAIRALESRVHARCECQSLSFTQFRPKRLALNKPQAIAVDWRSL